MLWTAIGKFHWSIQTGQTIQQRLDVRIPPLGLDNTITIGWLGTFGTDGEKALVDTFAHEFICRVLFT